MVGKKQSSKTMCANKAAELGKPSLSEMFTAMLGISSAGVTVTMQGADTRKDALASLAVEASMLAYDEKTRLNNRPRQAEIAASNLMEFMGAAKTIRTLERYQDVTLSTPKKASGGCQTGGQVRDVLIHIRDMLVRENAGGQERPESKFSKGYLITNFKAGYLPGESENLAPKVAEPEAQQPAVPEETGKNKKSAPWNIYRRAAVPV